MAKDKDNDKDRSKKEDFLLWKRFARDIEPIRDPDWEKFEKELADQAGADKQQDKQQEPYHQIIERVIPEIKEPNKAKGMTLSDFQMDRNTEERLRKGKMPIEGTIDLHGKNQGQAKESLERFILGAVKQNKRCLLVITGKGKTGMTTEHWMSPGEGVLKRKVPDWLLMQPLGQYVLKYVQARPSHGGAGALYVYLRKTK